MKSVIYKNLIFKLFALLFLFLFQNYSFATIFNFDNVANPQQEVPVSSGSSGKGTVSATYDDVTNLLSYTVTFTGLLGNSSAAHFHGNVMPGTNGGVQVGITIPTGVTSGSKTATATLTAVQETNLLAGLWYYNVHSSIFPGGEIRGQLIPKTTFELKVIPQGFFNTDLIALNSGDTVKVYARNNTSPYAIRDSAKSVISVNYVANFSFKQIYSGSYLLDVRHRNSIETWSSAAQSLTMGSSSFSYNFTFAQSRAFGNNQILVYSFPMDGSSELFAIYSGDINQDGTIDATDLSSVENDASNSLTGYELTDVTGDDFVDVGDVSIVENNVGVNVITP